MKTFKTFLKASNTQTNLRQLIQNILSSYRSTPHSTTRCSPAKLFLQEKEYFYVVLDKCLVDLCNPLVRNHTELLDVDRFIP